MLRSTITISLFGQEQKTGKKTNLRDAEHMCDVP